MRGGRRAWGPAEDPKSPRGPGAVSLLPVQGSGSWTTLIGQGTRVAIWAGLAGQVWEQQELRPAAGKQGLAIWLQEELPGGTGRSSCIQAALAEGLKSCAFPYFAVFSQTFNRKNLVSLGRGVTGELGPDWMKP